MTKKLCNNLTLILSLSWVTYLILHVILMGKVWVWNITSIIPPITLFSITIILFFAFIIETILSRRITKKSIISAAIIVFCLILALPISDINLSAVRDSSQQTTNNEQLITIFDWNTLFWEKPNNRTEILNYLKEQNADIYQLQEFMPSKDLTDSEIENFQEDEIVYIKEVFPDYYFFYYGDLLTISKYPILEEDKELKEYWIKLNIDVKGKVVSFYNVHIPVQFFGHGSVLNDIKNKFELRKFYFDSLEVSIKSNIKPFIITGDFNTTKSMGLMDKILKYTDDSISVSDNIFPYTWKSSLRLWRIDYCLVKNDITLIGHENVESNGLSDHWGIKVQIAI